LYRAVQHAAVLHETLERMGLASSENIADAALQLQSNVAAAGELYGMQHIACFAANAQLAAATHAAERSTQYTRTV
jgi:hypothetical protein